MGNDPHDPDWGNGDWEFANKFAAARDTVVRQRKADATPPWRRAIKVVAITSVVFSIAVLMFIIADKAIGQVRYDLKAHEDMTR